MTDFDVKKMKAEGVKYFVSLMIGALEGGFVDGNTVTLAQLHQVAKNHLKDSYDIDSADIIEEWGEDVAKLCGLEISDSKNKPH